MEGTLGLRIHVIEPLPDLAYCLQYGKAASAKKLEYQLSSSGDLTFELEVNAKQGKVKGSTNFTGPYTQGPPTARFFYLSLGQITDDGEPTWSGRVKVPLANVPWQQVERVLSNPELLLEASFQGTKENGSIAAATVPLLGGGWDVSPR
jgi:hypothetical protein